MKVGEKSILDDPQIDQAKAAVEAAGDELSIAVYSDLLRVRFAVTAYAQANTTSPGAEALFVAAMLSLKLTQVQETLAAAVDLLEHLEVTP